MDLEKESTVVLLGELGAGKSSLGNLLVFGEQFPEDGFEVTHGVDSPMKTCESRTSTWEGCRLTIFDTPGMPSPDRSTSLEKFDGIVDTIQRIPALNALVFLLAVRRLEEEDYQSYRFLLTQYSKLSCPIVFVCRVDSSNCPERMKQHKESAAIELIDRVVDKCGLATKKVPKYIFRHGEAGREDLEKLRRFLRCIPAVTVPEGTLMTSTEMKRELAQLSDERSRIATQQRAEISRLQRLEENHDARIAELTQTIDKKKWWPRLFHGPSFLSSGSGTEISQLENERQAAEEALESVSRDLKSKRAEAGSDQAFPEMKKAHEEYEQLQQLSS